MTVDTLKAYSMKDLAELAKKRGVRGWQSMRKEQLVKALMQVARAKAARPAASSKTSTAVRRAASVNGSASRNGHSHSTNGHAIKVAKKPQPAVPPKPVTETASRKILKQTLAARRLQEAKTKLEQLKHLVPLTPSGKLNSVAKDRLIVMVRDSYWLHAYWELTRQGVERARAAMGQDWHGAKPILRLMEVAVGTTTSGVESMLRDIEIHGGVNNWYIDVQDPPQSYRVDIGYRGPSGKFFVLARSNVVTTPKAGSKDAIDENWTDVAQNYDKIYAQSGGYSQDGSSGDLQDLFEERLRRPMGSPLVTNFGSGVEGLLPKKKQFFFEIDAELIVYGVTESDAHVTLQGEPVRLRPDGTFTMRFSLPNCRQVIPAVASGANGLEQRTIVLAVERNTKVMEPLVRDANDPSA